MFGLDLGPIDDFASTLPVVGSFVQSGDEQNMQNEYQKNQKLWQDLLNNYQGPESDPEYRNQLAGLADVAKGGLTPADRAAMLEAYSNASQMAKGREGAAEQRARMAGGGVATSGAMVAAGEGARQDAAQRYQSAGMQQAGVASNRALQARLAYLDTLERNRAALNAYRMNATGGMTGANTQVGNMYGARDASRKANMQHWLDTAANMYGRSAPPSRQYQGMPQAQDPYMYSDPTGGAGYT